MLKRSILAALCGASLAPVGYAQTDTSSASNFDDMKAQVVARLEKELSCVQAATSANAMQACRPQPPGGRQGAPPSQ